MITVNHAPTAALVFALLGIGVAPLGAAQGMDQAQMQQMMENAQKMQACMSDIDQSAMQEMAREAQTFQAEIKALCAAGKRKQAMSDAMAYGKRVNASPEMKKMRGCQKYMQGMMPDIAAHVPDPATLADSHICDE